MDRQYWQKINKETVELNYTFDQTELKDIYKFPMQIATDYTSSQENMEHFPGQITW